MNVAIIAAAGQGTRMAGNRPKQFLELAGVPVIFRTLEVFENCESIQQIVVVLATDQIEGFKAHGQVGSFGKISAIVCGGQTRAWSVRNGLNAAPEQTDVVVVHDAVRPFVSCEEIDRTVRVAQAQGAAVLVSKPVDTIKELRAGFIHRTIDRNAIRNALTPQSFQFDLLRRAYEHVDVTDPELTDEASLVERLGGRIAIVEGSARNIKITMPDDLLVAEALLKLAT
jgi:2-C-methyl-D-erythritol 4-phosphate cytidylyltransferase